MCESKCVKVAFAPFGVSAPLVLYPSICPMWKCLPQVSECMMVSAISRQRLEQVDAAKADLEAMEVVYNRALDELEVRVCGQNVMWEQYHVWDLTIIFCCLFHHLIRPHFLAGGSEGSLLPLPQTEGRTELADGPRC